MTKSPRMESLEEEHRLRVFRTVLGDIPAELAGVVLPHEHLICDSTVWLQDPIDSVGARMAGAQIAIENLWWMRQFPNTSREVVILDDEGIAISELRMFAEAGGSTLVDLTTPGIGRDVEALSRISARSGVHIVAATGFYIAAAHPSRVSTESISGLATEMIKEIAEGIGDTGIRAGVIGELGVSHPIDPNEAKVLRAAAHAQIETGAAISVHTAAHAIDVNSALEIADILKDAGADMDRVVMGHLDTSLHRPDYHRAVAERGCFLEFDLFGHEFFESENGFQSFGDTETARAVALLAAEGHADQLLVSQDTCYKIQLTEYGGYGYAHILRSIVPRLRLWGLAEDDIRKILVENPRRAFAIDMGPRS